MSRALGLIGLLCLLAGPGRAEVVEIPLSGLLGNYPAAHTVTVRLPQIPDLIHGASFRISGVASVGVADCGQAGEANLWPLEFSAEMTDSPENHWQATHEPSFVSGTFTWTAVFEPSQETTTWDFLMDGEGEITLTGAPEATLGACRPVLLPQGSVTEAVLIIDAQFPLGVESSTWGKIKALYRAGEAPSGRL